MFFALHAAHTFELKVSTVRLWAVPLALQYDEGHGPHDWDEVEREIHEISDDDAGSYPPDQYGTIVVCQNCGCRPLDVLRSVHGLTEK